MRILVVEAVTSGIIRNIDSSILSEGFAMLSSLVFDLARAGYTVSTVVSRDLLKLAAFLKPSKVFKLDKPRISGLVKLARSHDLTYVIAPESGGLLADLLERLDGFHVCSEPEATRQVSDKYLIASLLSKVGLNTPKTTIYKHGDRLDLGDINPPFIVKPRTGTGCEGLTLAKTVEELKTFLLKARNDVLIQEFVEGVPASVSLLTDGFATIPVSLNRQFIKLSRGMYIGGYTPMRHSLVKEAFKASLKAVETFKGLKGYIGVDIILSDDGVFIIEVNPRLTVSYAGLTRVLKSNLADAIVKAGLDGLHGFKPGFKAICYFRKTLFRGSISKALRRLASLDGLISPPIPVESSDEAYGFLAAVSNSLKNAKTAYHHLLDELSLETGCVTSW